MSLSYFLFVISAETDSFWSIVDQVVINKASRSVFDKRTDKTSATQYFQVLHVQVDTVLMHAVIDRPT